MICNPNFHSPKKWRSLYNSKNTSKFVWRTCVWMNITSWDAVIWLHTLIGISLASSNGSTRPCIGINVGIGSIAVVVWLPCYGARNVISCKSTIADVLHCSALCHFSPCIDINHHPLIIIFIIKAALVSMADNNGGLDTSQSHEHH